MRKVLVVTLLVLYLLVFGSAKDEIRKTREYVFDRLQNPQKYINNEIQQDAKSGPTTKCGELTQPILIFIFDPDEIVKSFRGTRFDLDDLVLAISVKGCGVKIGDYSMCEDIYDYDNTRKRVFGLLIMSLGEVSMNFSVNTFREGSQDQLGIRGLVLYDFVRYWLDDNERLGDLKNYLAIELDQIKQNYLCEEFSQNGVVSFLFKEQDSLLGKGSGVNLWLYICWVDFNVSEVTPAGIYKGTYNLTFTSNISLGSEK